MLVANHEVTHIIDNVYRIENEAAAPVGYIKTNGPVSLEKFEEMVKIAIHGDVFYPAGIPGRREEKDWFFRVLWIDGYKSRTHFRGTLAEAARKARAEVRKMNLDYAESGHGILGMELIEND